jgi:hypothetical protein
MHEYLASFTGAEGVVFIGRAQEKNSVFRTEKRRNAEGQAYPWIVRSTEVINQFYIYAVDADFGPFLLKFSSYFPYNAKLCQRPRVGQTPGGEGRDRLHRAGQRLRRGR